MTAYADARTGIEAMRNGAMQYVAKPFEMDEMLLLVRNAVDSRTLHREVEHLRQHVHERYSLQRIMGDSKAMQETIRQARIVADRPTTVLIRGKSGTGKELIARGIHAESGRKTFVAVNCAALPDGLLESELFGHEKGAFTGALAQKAGLFEVAGDGTIFLDEVGDISPRLQVKLLRVLQEREFTRVGGVAVITTDARVIAATNRNLEDAVAAGEFREDLYYRLSVFPVTVPSLADRVEDIPMLVDTFRLRHHHTAGMGDGVLRRLMEYSWPGNVRELENCIERAIIMAGDGPLDVSHLPEHIRENRALRAPSVFALPDEGISLDEVEKNLIAQALDRAGGNKSRAARLLGISRRAMYSKMKTHGIPGLGGEEEPAGES
jgi:two-component system response regulator PilR (NtrC family)